MRTGQWRRSLTLLVAAAVLAGCNSAEPQPSPTATEPTSSPATETPTPTNSPSDPYAVPDEITPEYVDLVVNKIYERHGELLRELLSQDPDPSAVMPVEMREHFAEVFDGQYLSRRVEVGDAIVQGERDNYKPVADLGQLRAEIERLVAVGDACVVAVGEWDNQEIAGQGFSIYAAFALERATGGATESNPTPWVIHDIAFNRDADGNPYPDDVMREVALADLTESVLETTCTQDDEL